MSLTVYRKKRNFKKTTEPMGKKSRSKKTPLFVIHKHAASHLHYDLRLEANGVLKSWAVPKGPSLDPQVKRLAVHVEDHPLDYGSFEGVIPKGQYGAGAVILWDTGTFELENKNFNQGYAKGDLTFTLKGKKLKGRFKLIRMDATKNWLLIKVADRYARAQKELDITLKKPNSVKSHLSIDAILKHSVPKKKAKPITPPFKQSKKSNMPHSISPQLAVLVEAAPEGNEWLHEIKLDGYRFICFIKNGRSTWMTRNHLDWTSKLTTLAKAINQKKLPNIILDGEVVVLDQHQRSNFQLLQAALSEKNSAPLLYYVFDIIYYDHYDLTSTPLIERKKLLKKIVSKIRSPHVLYNDHLIGQGNQVSKKACELGLEGIVSKKINAPYLQKRSPNWLKFKCTRSQEFIVGGLTQPKNQRDHFGALLIGTYDHNHQLQYNGRVGTGFSAADLKNLKKILLQKKITKCPFKTVPPQSQGVTWTSPSLIIQVNFTEWTQEGVLRHPSFQGIRKDKPAKKIKKETPIKPPKTIEPFSFNLSHPERILYPDENITKLDIANYYQSIEQWILPYLINRPLSLVRCPQGLQQACFYQKHLHGTHPKSLYTVTIDHEKYIYIKDKKGLLELVQMGVLEIHPWNCHISNLKKPDVIIFDLDPGPSVPWKKTVAAAQLIKARLEKIKLQSFVKTTGGKGLHIVVPLQPQSNWQSIKQFAKDFVHSIVELKPTEFTDNVRKSKRTGKIFLDYLRNQKGATSIAPYSTRARAHATVAVPLSWDELTVNLKPASFTISTVPSRLEKLKKDPWEKFFKVKQKI